MVTLFQFQIDAVNELLERVDSKQIVITLKAPTGSGKTIILAHFINEYLKKDESIRFVWLCPGNGELEEQSKDKVQSEFPNLNIQNLSEALLNGFNEGSVTFINWEAVSKENNRSVAESEFDNIYDKFQKAYRECNNESKFIFIIDESHLNVSTKKENTNAKAFLSEISKYGISKIFVSATPTSKENLIEIKEVDVINAGLITKMIDINPNIPSELTLTNAKDSFDVGSLQYNNEYEYLIDLAEKKRKEIFNAYKLLNKDINPLVVIQFPNGEESVKQIVKDYLSTKYHYTLDNEVGEYFADTKINLDNITDNNAPQKYLLFKQAIATGWDCLRAKILVKLREKGNSTFEIQTVGRIRRMPEQHHYGLDLLDNCFVYTFDPKYLEGLKDFNQSKYTNQLEIKDKFKSEITNLKLIKEGRDPNYKATIGEKEILKIIYTYFKETYNLSTVAKNKEKLEANDYSFSSLIISKIYTGKISVLNESNLSKLGSINIQKHPNMYYSKIQFDSIIHELSKLAGLTDEIINKVILHLFCIKQSISGEKSVQFKILSLSQNDLMTFVINNKEKLKWDISCSISKIISNKSNVMKSFFKLKPYESDFKIPQSDIIKFDSGVNQIKYFNKNIYEHYNSQNCSNLFRSQSEIDFENYCEKNSNVEWFYKNGDVGNQYFSILYQDTILRQFLFYPDYIVKFKDQIWIIEVKGGIKSIKEPNNESSQCIKLSSGSWIETENVDKLASHKFYALKNYLISHNLLGGFVRKNQSDVLCIAQEYYTEDMTDNLPKGNQINNEHVWIPLDDIWS